MYYTSYATSQNNEIRALLSLANKKLFVYIFRRVCGWYRTGWKDRAKSFGESAGRETCDLHFSVIIVKGGKNRSERVAGYIFKTGVKRIIRINVW